MNVTFFWFLFYFWFTGRLLNIFFSFTVKLYYFEKQIFFAWNMLICQNKNQLNAL